MSQETIYKAQEKALMHRNRSRSAVVLIAGGIGLLALTLSGISLLEILSPLIFVGGLGLLLLWPAYRSTAERPSRAAWLAVPGALFLTLGTLITVLMLIGRPETMAYAWTFLPMSLVGGLMYARRFEKDHPIHDRGPKILRGLGWIFVGAGLFFELLVFESLGPWWPLVLVGYGIYMLSRQRRGQQ